MNYNKETQWKSPSKRRAVLYKKSACLISEVTEYFHALQNILNYIKKKYINILLVDIFYMENKITICINLCYFSIISMLS